MSFEQPPFQKNKTKDFTSRVSEELKGLDSFERTEELLGTVDEQISFYRTSGFDSNSPFVDLVAEHYDAHIQGNFDSFLAQESAYYGDLQSMSPRVSDFFQAVLSKAYRKEYTPNFDVNKKKIAAMQEAGDFDVLFSSDHPLAIKANRLNLGMSGFVNSLRSLDKREGHVVSEVEREKRKKILEQQSSAPRTRSNSVKPGVDAMSRLKEGEKAPAYWTILPPWGGYYKRSTYTQWDNKKNEWFEPNYTYQPYVFYKKGSEKDTHTMRGLIPAGAEISVPLPYTHGIVSVTSSAGKCEVKQDQFGDAIVILRGASSAEVSIVITKVNKKPRGVAKDIPKFISRFTNETEAKLNEIAQITGSLAKARALRQYVFSHVQYLSPKDAAEADYYNTQYRTDARGFAGAVDALKKGDCDTVNTYFSALCSRLGIVSRHCWGDNIKGKGESGGAEIHSGTGHAWTEVWDDVDREWKRVDATPPGDPNLQEEGEGENGESVPGDYGKKEGSNKSKEDKRTLEELLALRKEVDELRKKLSYTKEERSIAEAVGVSLVEARNFVKEIHAVESMQLPNGQRILDVLSQVFSVILQTRKASVISYDGPLRRREGGEYISDVVSHKIGIKSGDFDPISREKEVPDTETRLMSGGFDLFMIGDKSGSMTIGYNDGTILQEQRRVMHLLASALHNFQRNVSRESLSKESSFSVRSEVVSFDPEITVEKKLDAEFTGKAMYTMWKNLGEGGSSNDEVSALHAVINNIEEDIARQKKLGNERERTRLVVLCSDGGIYSKEVSAHISKLMEQLSSMGAVVVGIGLTESGKAIPKLFHNPPHSYGHVLKDITKLPLVVASHVVSEVVKLMPSDKKKEAEALLAEVMKKITP